MDYKYTPEALRSKLIEIVREGTTHQDYAHVTKYAKWCHQIMTGEDHREILVKYKQSETKDQQDQRVRLYDSRTKHLGHKVSSQFLAIEKTDNVIEMIEYEGGKKDDPRLGELDMRLKNFYDDASLKRYLYDDVRHYVFHDPNAWLIVEGTENDPRMERPWTYPFIASSTQAVDFEYHIGILQYLVVRLNITVLENEGKKNELARPGHHFTLYGPGTAIEMIELADDDPIVPEGYELLVVEKDDFKIKNYAFDQFDTPTPVVPAQRFGYLKDPRTDKRTFVSPIYPAEEILRDIIKTKSEYDLARALHGFIQKFALAKTCDYSTDDGDRCVSGTMMLSQSECPRCKGFGLIVHKSVQDVILIEMPEAKDEHIPLSDFVHYVEIPDYIIKAYRDDLEKLEKEVSTAIFNAQVFDRSEVAITATEKRLDQEQLYNVLTPYADNWSRMFVFVVRRTAEIMDIAQKLVVDHRFPLDFKLETIYELIQMRKSATDAGTPQDVIQSIDKKILAKQNRDNPEYVTRVEIREKFRPFQQLSTDERMQVVGMLDDLDPEKILYIRFSSIFRDITEEQPKFYDMPFDKQREIVDGYVDKYVEDMRQRKERNRQPAPEPPVIQ